MMELIEEHKKGRKLILVLDNLKKTKKHKEKGELFSSIVDLYVEHIKKENTRFFLPAFAYFSDKESDEILSEFFETDRKIIHEKYLRVVKDLEILMK